MRERHPVAIEDLVLELVASAAGARTSTSVLMRDAFRKEALRPRQQKRVKDLLHRMLSQARLLDHALAVATRNGVAPQVADQVRLLACQVWTREVSTEQAAERAAWVDWQRVARIRDDVRALPDRTRRVALLGSLPDALAKRMVEQFGDDAQALAEALCTPAPLVLRCNSLKGDREQLAARLASEGIATRATRFASHALEVTSAARLFRSPTFHAGWFEVQDEASQLVAEVTAPPPRGTVVDACAGAGGKTLALAAALGNRGTVWALDVDGARLDDLKARARRAGASNVRTALVPPDHWPPQIEAVARGADRILVDAPCSGFGTLRRNPEMRWRIDDAELRRIAAAQRDLARRAAAALAPGARLVYATCTFLREENEAVVDEVRAADPGLQPVRIAEILGNARALPIADQSGTYLVTAPHRHGTDAFFAAVLRR